MRNSFEQAIPFEQPFEAPNIQSMPSFEADFLKEVHRSLLEKSMVRLLGEVMTEKTSTTADAKQKRK